MDNEGAVHGHHVRGDGQGANGAEGDGQMTYDSESCPTKGLDRRASLCWKDATPKRRSACVREEAPQRLTDACKEWWPFAENPSQSPHSAELRRDGVDTRRYFHFSLL